MANVLAALIMVKNEELSIQQTIDSTKGFLSDIIVYDTGSTDNTIQIVKDSCKRNGQRLHLKQGIFTTFPESRNESIKFAETVDVDNLLMMDAGDEIHCDAPTPTVLNMIRSMPHEYKFGTVCLRWLEDGGLTEHNDIRFIKNKRGCRYNNKYPVHEEFDGLNVNPTLMLPYIVLYQNRDKYSGSTDARIKNDIDLLFRAEPCTRNYYYLAQSYLYMKDYSTCYKYNMLALDANDGTFDVSSIYSRLGYCAIVCNMYPYIVIPNLKMAIESSANPMIGSYINLLKYCLENNILDVAIPYLEPLAKLDKTKGINFNHDNYDYFRWVVIYQVCYASKKKMDLGKFACNQAILARDYEVDKLNLKLFDA